MNKKSFRVHMDNLEILDYLTIEEIGYLFLAIYKYQLGEPYHLDKPLNFVFIPFKTNFINDDKNDKLGQYHWNWKGGITPENKLIRNSACYKDWRKSVFERDNYTCQICFKRGYKIHAHHIKKFSEYPKLRFDINNGVTVCKDCHIVIHKSDTYD